MMEERTLNAIEKSVLHSEIVEAIKTIYDPEIPVNIYDLGLIYGLEITDNAEAKVTMTLTSPMCPVAESLPVDVENVVASVPGVGKVTVDLTWDPPFSLDMMSEDVKLMLGLL
jgi:FeS assembly SUF system protein